MRSVGIVNQVELQPRVPPVTCVIESPQAFDRCVVGTMPPLVIDIFLKVAWLRSNNLYLMFRQELGNPCIRFSVSVICVRNDRRVATIRDLPSQISHPSYKRAKVRVHLRAPAGQVDTLDLWIPGDPIHNTAGGHRRHVFLGTVPFR